MISLKKVNDYELKWSSYDKSGTREKQYRGTRKVQFEFFNAALYTEVDGLTSVRISAMWMELVHLFAHHNNI